MKTIDDIPDIGGPAWTVPITPGPWLQLYLDSMRSSGEVRLMIRRAKRLEMAGVIMHAGPTRLERSASLFTEMAREESVSFALSVGVDSDSLTIQRKADCISNALDRVGAAQFCLIDAEGAWDIDTGVADETDEAGALKLGAELRKRHPAMEFGDQAWYAMQVHGDERKKALPLGQGGTFAGFPSDEFASWLDFRSTQPYFRNSSSPTAYQDVMIRCERDWAIHEKSLARLNLVRPRTYTFQGYGHENRPYDFVDAMLRVRHRPSFIWWDAQYRGQWDITASCIEAARRIVVGGHAPAGRSTRDCVRSFQRATGMQESDVDGLCGWRTMGRVGMTIPV